MKSFEKVVEKFNVHRKSVSDWVDLRAEDFQMILNNNDRMKRLTGAGRKLNDQALDEYLIRWVEEQRQKKFYISIRKLIAVAIKYFKDSNFKFF